MTNLQVHLVQYIIEERHRQDAKWGDADGRMLPLTTWQTVLTEEVGEVAKAILRAPLDGKRPVQAELIQVAAVALAMLESLDHSPIGVEEGDAG